MLYTLNLFSDVCQFSYSSIKLGGNGGFHLFKSLMMSLNLSHSSSNKVLFLASYLGWCGGSWGDGDEQFQKLSHDSSYNNVFYSTGKWNKERVLSAALKLQLRDQVNRHRIDP